MLVPRHAIRRIDGVDIHWAELGEGRPLVLLHGICDSHRTWTRVLPALARTHRVLAVDLPGHGLSARPDASYSLAWQAQLMSRWVDALGLEDVDLVGHSYGGGVAEYMLLDVASRIRRLALVAPGGLGPEVGFWLRLMSMTNLVERIGQPFMAPFTNLGLRFLPGVFDADDVAWMSWSNGMPGSARGMSRTIRDVIDWRGQKRQFLERVHEVAALPPVALFWGTKDPVIPHVHAERVAGALEGIAITRFDCGHFPHRERPDAFGAALAGFLAPTWLPAPRLRLCASPGLARRPSALRRAWSAVVGALRKLVAPSAIA